MTRVSGSCINTTPCCGASFSTPRYTSINFSAWEYWTDGYREGSLMPNDQGLRRCKCGSFYLLSEMQHICHVDQTDIPLTIGVKDGELHQAITQARTPQVEVAARMLLWQQLNHPYRQMYRAHRQAEEDATQAQWEAANPDARSWWQRFRKVPPPQYHRPADAPFTYPPFQPTSEQRDNMKALLDLLSKETDGFRDPLVMAELHRELGQFEEAARNFESIEEKDDRPGYRVIGQMVKEKQNVPMRYRM